MSMISYASNLEDVMIQRVFSDIEDGCFVDVGASNPIFCSLTYALYEKGWRGVAMEPQEGAELAWSQARPGDLLLKAGAGSQEGELTLYLYAQAGQISSMSQATRAHWERNNMLPTSEIKVPIVTLNQVIETHLPNTTIHFMNIDVEGMEMEVLRGLNLNQHRPWLIVLEATEPGSPVLAHHEWEPYLLDHRYEMVYFDGVNRYYLAEEHADLRERFSLPPNVWDNYIPFAQVQLQEQVEELRAEVAALQAQLQQAQQQLRPPAPPPEKKSFLGRLIS